MAEQDPLTTPETQFIDTQFRRYGQTAMDELSVRFLGDNAERFQDDVEVIYFEGTDKGEVVPTVSCDFNQRKLMLIIEESPVLNFAERFVDDADTQDFSVGDITRLLVGAGVARSILAWSTLPILGADASQSEFFRDKICDKRYLWQATDAYDDRNGTRLRSAVEKINDDQITKINVLRFAFGASLQYLSEVHDLQINVPASFIEQLSEQEESRQLDLRMHLAILDKESAFKLYDDSVPELAYALSFPMSPGEELELFSAHPTD